MGYNFTFDLSKLTQKLFKEIAEFSEKEKVAVRIGDTAIKLVKKFNVDKITGMSVCDSITVIEDLITANIKNSLHKKHFLKTNKRVLFLPHCCRKYMNSRCKADFIPETSSYLCKHCSNDCQVNKATKLAKKENYDVYVLPGSSCIKKIFQKNSYDGVIGVACTEEIGHESLTLKPICIAVNISGLKRFAAESLPSNSQLRAVLLSERDQLTAKDLMAKMDVWMRLLNIEKLDLLV